MKATPEYQIKYLNALIWDIFEFYKIQDSIISVNFNHHELKEEFKFEYYFIDFPKNEVLEDVDYIESDLEERIRNSFEVGDAYVFLTDTDNKIEIVLYHDMILRFDYEAIKFMRDDKLDGLLD